MCGGEKEKTIRVNAIADNKVFVDMVRKRAKPEKQGEASTLLSVSLYRPAKLLIENSISLQQSEPMREVHRQILTTQGTYQSESHSVYVSTEESVWNDTRNRLLQIVFSHHSLQFAALLYKFTTASARAIDRPVLPCCHACHSSGFALHHRYCSRM